VGNPEFSPLSEETDSALVAFLRAELDLGFTYAQTAKVEAEFDSAGEKRATELAKAALETVHRFCNRITDPLIQLELQDGAAELEKILSEPRTQL
jgi:hypothetical protein